jgi:dethiobiotin synthetase
MGASFFITGTDTGVGKTFFAASLAAALKDRGYSVGVFKPIESGCESKEGELFPADARKLWRAAGEVQSLDQICPVRLSAPLAPGEAARLEGVMIDRNRIIRVYEETVETFDVTIVEGAGGLFVPLYEGWTVLELIRELGVPVINVVGSKLGAINHALLTERAILAESVELFGHVINNLLGDQDPAVKSNPGQIAAQSVVPILGVLPPCPDPWLDPGSFAECFDLQALLVRAETL